MPDQPGTVGFCFQNSRVGERETHYCVGLPLERTWHRPPLQAFLPICLQIKITKCYRINKPLIAPWNTCPFPTDNLVVIYNIKVLYMFIIYIYNLQHFKVVCPI
jgi:hypothetical protein